MDGGALIARRQLRIRKAASIAESTAPLNAAARVPAPGGHRIRKAASIAESAASLNSAARVNSRPAGCWPPRRSDSTLRCRAMLALSADSASGSGSLRRSRSGRGIAGWKTYSCCSPEQQTDSKTLNNIAWDGGCEAQCCCRSGDFCAPRRERGDSTLRITGEGNPPADPDPSVGAGRVRLHRVANALRAAMGIISRDGGCEAQRCCRSSDFCAPRRERGDSTLRATGEGNHCA